MFLIFFYFNLISSNLWSIYYNNFENIQIDGKWFNWNIKKLFLNTSTGNPPKFICNKNKPLLGIYSSNDLNIIKIHLKWAEENNISALIIPWYNDFSLELIIELSLNTKIKICPLISNYLNRNETTIINNINFYLTNYLQYDSILYYNNKPVIFIESLNGINSTLTLNIDAYYILITNNKNDIINSYESFFNGISLSNLNWKFEDYNFLINKNFNIIPMIYPGFNKSKYDPRLKYQTIKRFKGKTFLNYWNESLKLNSKIFLLNSFNGWKDSTYIEPIKCNSKCNPYYYLNLTSQLYLKKNI